jgi:hypothetical protein
MPGHVAIAIKLIPEQCSRVWKVTAEPKSGKCVNVHSDVVRDTRCFPVVQMVDACEVRPCDRERDSGMRPAAQEWGAVKADGDRSDHSGFIMLM